MVQVEVDTKQEGFTRLQWSCKICGKIYASKQGMEDHIRGAHMGSQTMFPCFYCDKTFQSRNSRSGHCSKHHKAETGRL